MYSLDVNFLRERRQTQQAPRETATRDQGEQAAVSPESNLPLIIGAVVAVALPAVVGGYWYFLNVQTTRVQSNVAELEQELGNLQNQQQQVAQKREALARTEANLTALANIFNKIKPLSAVLEDVRDRAPSNLQINSFQQNASNFTIEGVGESYEVVNYFALTLQRSPIIIKESVNLQTATKQPSDFQLDEETAALVGEITAKPVINYTISFQLNDQSASELLPFLQEQGATGLVTRIRTLEQRGIVQ